MSDNGSTKDSIPGVLMARVSSDRQATAGTSLESQLQSGYGYSAEHGIAIVAAFSDDISGATPVAERPGGAEVYALARSGTIRAVVMHTLDRSARDEDVVEYLIFKRDMRRLGVTLHFVDTGVVSYDPLGSVLEFLRAAQAADERKKILERTTRGKRSRNAKGLPMTTPPLAYTPVRDQFGRPMSYEFKEELRGFFDELARRFLSHEPYRLMAARLGNNPMTGTPLAGRTVQYILESPFYRGQVAQFGGGRIPGRQAPVWDEATCAAIAREVERRRSLKQNVSRWKTTRAPLALLDGILRCGCCGCMLALRWNKARRPETPGTRSYFCNQAHEARQLARALGVPRPEWPAAAHPPVAISERRALTLIREALQATTDAEIDSYFATGGVLAVSLPAIRSNPERRRWLEQQIADAERGLAELRSELEGMRAVVARRAVEAEIERLAAAVSEWRAELDRDQQVAEGVDHARLRADMLFLRDTPGVWDLPKPELRRILHERLPDLYVRDGELVLAR